MTTSWFSRLQSTLAPRKAAPSRRRARSLRNLPRFESLEDRQMLSAVFTVTNNLDSGPGSLRQAIISSNANPPVSQVSHGGGLAGGVASAPFNLIEFSLPYGSTITPQSGGSRRSRSRWKSSAPRTISPRRATSRPSIVLNGSQAGYGTVGLTIQSSGVDVDQLAIDSFSGGGVLFNGAAATGSWLRNDFIGVNLAGSTPGTVAAGNGTFGVELAGGASNNELFDNVISANSGNGVVLTGAGTSGNFVATNLIGTDRTGTHALGNGGSGVVINLGATGNTIDYGNVISGNGYCGVYLNNSGTTGNVISGDFIGTNLTGTAALGNSVTGVEIAAGASSNTVGPGDVLSGNTWNGVAITDVGSEHITWSPATTSAPTSPAPTCHQQRQHRARRSSAGPWPYNMIGTGNVILRATRCTVFTFPTRGRRTTPSRATSSVPTPPAPPPWATASTASRS